MIMDTQYGLSGDGLPGNDDYATMSAWFIFSALGFYPIPSTGKYALGSPVVSSARIYRKKEEGKVVPFNINVQNNRKGKFKVESVNINGVPLDRFVTH